MSNYDLWFVQRQGSQTWKDAFEAAERSGELSTTRLAEWDRLVVIARERLGDVEVFATPDTHEITSTTVQLSLWPDAARIRIIDAADIDARDRAYELASAVIRETGLPGYDVDKSRILRGAPSIESGDTDTPLADRISEQLASPEIRETMRDVERQLRRLWQQFGGPR